MSKRKNRHARFWVAAVGFVLAAAGIGGIVQGLQQGAGKNNLMLDVSQTVLVVGAVFIGAAVLSMYRVTIDESYKFGYDLGYEKGFKEGRKTSRPVVVDLVYPRDEVTIRQQPE